MSRSDWQDFQLGELCSFKAGSAFPQSAQGLSEGDLPFIKVSDMNLPENKIRVLASNNWVSFDTAKTLKAAPLQSGVPVFAKIGEALKANRIRRLSRPTIVDNNMMGAVPTSDEIDELFLFHLLRQLDLAQWATGTSVPYLTVSVLSQIQIRIPPKVIQRRIAAILSAYDDLIENNTRRIEILEEMAWRLYEEWFVHFRFPGHEEMEFKESELGRIPANWEVVALHHAADLTMGQSPRSEFYNQSGEGLPFHQGVTDFGDFFPSNRLYCTVKNRTAEKGDILFSVRAPVGRINISTERIVIGRGVSAIRSKDGHQIFLLSQMRHIFKEEDSIGNGAIFKAVTKNDMESIGLVQPESELLSSFESIATPFWKQIRLLTTKNGNLRAQRDLLLPKLVSGEIDVSDLPLPDEASSEAA